MNRLKNLRAVVRSKLDCDDARIDQIVCVGHRVGLTPVDALITAWLAASSSYYCGQRGPRPADPILRAVEVEGERQAATAMDWDSSATGALDAALELRDAMATSWHRGRQRGTRPQAQRRAAARYVASMEAGQAAFGGFGWGMPA